MKKRLTITLLLTTLYGDSISYLNNIRDSVGLNKLTSEQHLQLSASSHAIYLLEHGINSHYEKEGKFFVAKTPSLRAIKNGYTTKDIKENITTNAKNEEASIDTLLSAIYHRFVFLDFDIDQIGKGVVIDDTKPTIKSVYVYDMGLSSIAKLCKKDFLTLEGVYYMQNICQDSMHYIPKEAYQKAKDKIRSQNPKMVLFPNANQADVPTAFFQEYPNPMPGYKVSGYPISVELNPYYFQDIKIKKFRLYNQKGRMVRVKLLKYVNDPNKKLKPYQFAIIPLQRLDYNKKYKAYFEAYTDKGKVKYEWYFTTKNFDKPLYTITKDYNTIHVANNKTIILYIKPRNRKDILDKISFKNAKVDYIDANTLKVSIQQLPATIIADRRKVTIKR